MTAPPPRLPRSTLHVDSRFAPAALIPQSWPVDWRRRPAKFPRPGSRVDRSRPYPPTPPTTHRTLHNSDWTASLPPLLWFVLRPCQLDPSSGLCVLMGHPVMVAVVAFRQVAVFTQTNLV